jgi:hypothetical protein
MPRNQQTLCMASTYQERSSTIFVCVYLVGVAAREVYCRGGSRASVGAAVPATLPRVFLQRVPL